jgi:hypothetical protein
MGGAKDILITTLILNEPSKRSGLIPAYDSIGEIDDGEKRITANDTQRNGAGFGSDLGI